MYQDCYGQWSNHANFPSASEEIPREIKYNQYILNQNKTCARVMGKLSKCTQNYHLGG